MTKVNEIGAVAALNDDANSSEELAMPLEYRTDVTVDELERTPMPYPAELYDGKVVFKMASPEHGMIQLKIGKLIDSYLEEHAIGYVMTETNFRLWPDLMDQSRIPDVAFVRKARMPKNLHRFPVLAPDLAVEVVSPEDNYLAVMNKADEYLDQGTEVVWVVNATRREVLVCTRHGKRSVRDVLTAPELLPGFELPVAKIFEGLPY